MPQHPNHQKFCCFSLPNYFLNACSHLHPLLWFISPLAFDNVFQLPLLSLLNPILKPFGFYSLITQFLSKLFSQNVNLNTLAPCMIFFFHIAPSYVLAAGWVHFYYTSLTGPNSPLVFVSQVVQGHWAPECTVLWPTYLHCGNLSLTDDPGKSFLPCRSLSSPGEAGLETPFLGLHKSPHLYCCLH